VRMVPACARASSVPWSPSLRNWVTSTYASDENHSRS
jgi:hypothetical protein